MVPIDRILLSITCLTPPPFAHEHGQSMNFPMYLIPSFCCFGNNRETRLHHYICRSILPYFIHPKESIMLPHHTLHNSISFKIGRVLSNQLTENELNVSCRLLTNQQSGSNRMKRPANENDDKSLHAELRPMKTATTANTPERLPMRTVILVSTLKR